MALRAMLGKDSLIDGAALRRTVQRSLPPGAAKFGDLQIPFYAVTADIISATTIIFGDEADTPLLDPVLASASFPIVLPPVEYDGFQLSDGGVTAVVPIEVALQRGATELYVVDLEPPVAKSEAVRGVLPIAMQTLTTSLREQLMDDLRDVIKVRRDACTTSTSPLSRICHCSTSRRRRALIDAGRVAMDTYLDAPKPNTIQPLTDIGASAAPHAKGGRPLHP